MSEVIIDGCNVAECVYASNSIPVDCENDTCFCYENPNCYFKQLQRAKAEKQDLINYYELREGGMLEDIQHWKNKAQELYKELKQYKKSKQASYEAMQKEWNAAINELRELKAELTVQKAVAKGFSEGLALTEKLLEKAKAENEKLKAMAGVYSVKLMEKYKQALEEIKELLRGHQIADKARIEIILDLINKALND